MSHDELASFRDVLAQSRVEAEFGSAAEHAAVLVLVRMANERGVECRFDDARLNVLFAVRSGVSDASSGGGGSGDVSSEAIVVYATLASVAAALATLFRLVDRQLSKSVCVLLVRSRQCASGNVFLLFLLSMIVCVHWVCHSGRRRGFVWRANRRRAVRRAGSELLHERRRLESDRERSCGADRRQFQVGRCGV